MDTKKVSVIIVNYRTSALVIDCIRSIKEKTLGVDYEIIVVDNNSEPDIDTIMRENFGESVVCVKLSNNLGFGLANNKGFKVAKGEYIFCLNPDTLLLNNAIKVLSDYLDANHLIGACGGNLYDADMRPAYSFYRVLPGLRWELFFLSANKLSKFIYRGNWCHNYTNTPLIVPYITGADLMMRREVVNQTSGFSEAFFMYYEETDLCARIGKLGHSIACVPQARIQHLEGVSFKEGDTINPHRYEMMEAGRATYMRRHMPIWKRWLCDRIYECSLMLFHSIFKITDNPLHLLYKVHRQAFRKVHNQQHN